MSDLVLGAPKAGRKPEFSFSDDAEGRAYTFSQTALNRYRKCPERARAYWCGEYEDPSGVEAIVGTAVHAAAEASYTGKDPVRAMADAVVAEWHQGIDPGHMWGQPEDALEAAARAWAVLERYLSTVKQPIAVERELRAPLPGGRYSKFTRGKVDMIYDTKKATEVIDYKVSKGRSYSNKSELQKYAVQPDVYLNNVSQVLDIPLHRLEFVFIVINPLTGEVTTTPVTREPHDIAHLSAEADTIIDAWEAGLKHWPLRVDGWWCSEKWCSNWKNCLGGVS